MARSTATDAPAETDAQIANRTTAIKRMLMVGAVFVGVGYLLLGLALFLELTQFHPLLERFFSQQTAHSLAGGGPDRAGSALLNRQLATIHQFPSTLLWLKLGGIGHILVGIFIALGAIVRALSAMPTRLGATLQSGAQATAGGDPEPSDD
jgi:small-conductance mechanosensitive channel